MQTQQQSIEHSPTTLSVSYSAVTSEHIDGVWPVVAPLIEKSLVYFDNRVDIDDIYNSLKARNNQLWLVIRDGEILTAVVTEITIYPKKKVLNIAYLAGRDFRSWQDGIDILKDFAKSLGCSSIEIRGRRGWEKLLKDFRVLNVTQVLDL